MQLCWVPRFHPSSHSANCVMSPGSQGHCHDEDHNEYHEWNNHEDKAQNRIIADMGIFPKLNETISNPIGDGVTIIPDAVLKINIR